MRVQFEHVPQSRASVGFDWMEAVDGFGQHQSEGVLARAARSGQDEGLGKAIDGDALAEMGHRCRIAEKI